jgi:hypothetical protein
VMNLVRNQKQSSFVADGRDWLEKALQNDLDAERNEAIPSVLSDRLRTVESRVASIQSWTPRLLSSPVATLYGNVARRLAHRSYIRKHLPGRKALF